MKQKSWKQFFFNGSSARILSKIGYQNGQVEYSISQINLYTGRSEYFRQFSNQIDAEMAF